jgi:hypothetical protein
MIGDAEWRELLEEVYQEHVAMSARCAREPITRQRFYVERTWTDFVRLAQLVEALPPFALKDWATSNPVPGGQGGQFASRMLARRLIGAFVLVNAIMKELRRQSRRRHAVVRHYLDNGGRVRPGQEKLLAQAKRWIFDWLIHTSEGPAAREVEYV